MVIPRVVKEKELHDSYRRRYERAKKAPKDKFTAANPQDLLRSAPGTAVSANPAIDEVVQEWMVALRRVYEGCTIRRTIATLDLDGLPISGLPPKHNEVIMIKLTEDEQKHIDALADRASSDGTLVSFYIHGSS